MNQRRLAVGSKAMLAANWMVMSYTLVVSRGSFSSDVALYAFTYLNMAKTTRARRRRGVRDNQKCCCELEVGQRAPPAAAKTGERRKDIL